MVSIRNGQILPNADSADQVEEIPLNNATIHVSDGTDNYTDGDVVIVGNWDGQQVAAVVGNLSDGTSLVDVDLGVDGTLGGLL